MIYPTQTLVYRGVLGIGVADENPPDSNTPVMLTDEVTFFSYYFYLYFVTTVERMNYSLRLNKITFFSGS